MRIFREETEALVEIFLRELLSYDENEETYGVLSTFSLEIVLSFFKLPVLFEEILSIPEVALITQVNNRRMKVTPAHFSSSCRVIILCKRGTNGAFLFLV